MVDCIASRMSAIRSVPSSAVSSLLDPPYLVIGLAQHDSGGVGPAAAAYSAAALPARGAEDQGFRQRVGPSRFAPLMVTHAVSPAANSPSMGVAPLMSVATPPIM